MNSKHARISILTLLLAFVVGACSTSTGGTSSGSPAASNVAVATLPARATPVATPTAAPTATAAPSSGGGASPTPGAIDPCTLLTVDEASTLIGKKLSAGVSQTVDPDRVCTFKSGLTEVKLILAPPAPDAKTAQADWDLARSQIPAGIPVIDLTSFDRSAYGTGAAAGVSISALFVIQGTYFFDLYCGFPACTQGASVTAAQDIVGRLP